MSPKKDVIVLVDDNAVNIQIIIKSLENIYRIIPFTSVSEALGYIEHHADIDLILLDIDMIEMNGYSAFKTIKTFNSTLEVPVIFITARNDVESEITAFNMGIVDYIKKPIVPKLAKMRIEYHINARKQIRLILEESTKIRRLTEVTIRTLTTFIDHFNDDSERHIDRIIRYVSIIVGSLKEKGNFSDEITNKFVSDIKLSAPFHDCGKLFLNDRLLSKKDTLTPEELVEVKKHTLYSSKVLKTAQEIVNEPSFFDMAEELSLYYHERWDGKGYPFGLKELEIPLSARIMSIADVYDALVFSRPYKEKVSHEMAVEIIMSEKEKSFDPIICDAFFFENDKFKLIKSDA